MYSRHTSRFLSLFCFTLPLVLLPTMGLTVIPTLAIVSWALFSIEEIGHTIGNWLSFPQLILFCLLFGLCLSAGYLLICDRRKLSERYELSSFLSSFLSFFYFNLFNDLHTYFIFIFIFILFYFILFYFILFIFLQLENQFLILFFFFFFRKSIWSFMDPGTFTSRFHRWYYRYRFKGNIILWSSEKK